MPTDPSSSVFCLLYVLALPATAADKAIPASTQALGKLEVIEVTAQKIVQNIQPVPVSVTVIKGPRIAANAVQDLSALSVQMGMVLRRGV